MTDIHTLPCYSDANGWWEILPHRAPAPRLTGNQQADIAIIGGGIAGLSTAYRLAEHDPSLDIVVLEAMEIGHGASGKNSGFMLDFHSHGDEAQQDRLQRNIALWQDGLDRMRSWVEQHSIQCQWSEWGRLYGAHDENAQQNLDNLARQLKQMGRTFERFGREQTHLVTGSHFYKEGLHVPGAVLCNPAALMRGLKDALPDNVTVFERSAVCKMNHSSKGFSVQTSQAALSARKLVLATGALTKHFGVAKQRYVGISTYASLSDIIPQGDLPDLEAGTEFGLFEAQTLGATIRLTQDRRLLYRDYFTHDASGIVTPSNVHAARSSHRRSVSQRWPALADINLPYSWGGTVVATSNDGLLFGELRDNLFFVMASDVAPMTKGASLGSLMADYIVGHESPLLFDTLAAPRAKRLPPQPFLDIGLSWKLRRRH